MAIEKISFSFNEWAALAKLDPVEFEQRREETVLRVITKATNVRRMEGLQWRIDVERTRARTPLKATLRLSSMMWDSFHELAERLNRAVGYELPRCSSTVPALQPPPKLRLVPRTSSSPCAASSAYLENTSVADLPTAGHDPALASS